MIISKKYQQAKALVDSVRTKVRARNAVKRAWDNAVRADTVARTAKHEADVAHQAWVEADHVAQNLGV